MQIVDIIAYMYDANISGISTEIFLLFSNGLFFYKNLQKRNAEKKVYPSNNFVYFIYGLGQSFVSIVATRYMLHAFHWLVLYMTHGLLDSRDIILLCKAAYFAILLLINYLFIVFNVGFKNAGKEFFGSLNIFKRFYISACYKQCMIVGQAVLIPIAVVLLGASEVMLGVTSIIELLLTFMNNFWISGLLISLIAVLTDTFDRLNVVLLNNLKRVII